MSMRTASSDMLGALAMNSTRKPVAAKDIADRFQVNAQVCVEPCGIAGAS